MKNVIIVKKWLLRTKIQDLARESGSYNAEFTEICEIKDGKDSIGIIGDIVRETEKAVCLSTQITDVMGNDRSWNVWFPKSQIIKTTNVKAEA